MTPPRTAIAQGCRSTLLLLGVSAALSFTSTAARAAVLVYDGFNYTAASNVTGQSGGTGNWTAAWTGGSSMTVTNGGLTYSNSGGTLTTGGNAAFEVNTASTGNARTWNGLTTTEGSEMWFSCLVNTAASGSDLRISALNTASNITSGFSGIGVMLTSGRTVNLTIGATTTTMSPGVTLGSGVTSLIVMRLSFSDTAGADALTVWVDPTLGGSGAPAGGTTLNGTFDNTWLAAPTSGFRGGSSWTGTVDELRAGTTFADVAPIPEPAAGILAAGGLLIALRRRRS